MCAPLDVRHWGLANIEGAASATWPIELVRAQINHCIGVAVIGAFKDDYIVTTCMRPSQTQRQFVCLATTRNQIDDAQRIRQQGAQALYVVDQVLMKVAGVGVENCHLLANGVYDSRMTVP